MTWDGTRIGRRVSLPKPPATRILGLGAILTLLGAYLQVLYDIVDVTGDPTVFWLCLGGALLGATILARFLRVVTAIALASALLVGGLAWYVVSLPWSPDPIGMLNSNLELLSGQSILRIERAGLWAISVTPGPVFVTWYLALRRWYTSAVVVASFFLGYVVLTGNSGTLGTLVGVIGAGAAIGFGDLDRRSYSGPATESVAIVLAVMILVPAFVSVVPTGAGSPLSLDTGPGGDGGGTLEADLIGIDGELDIRGAIELSTTVRYTVQADRGEYWRVAGFDRFTGDGWVQTGSSTPYRDGTLSQPPGESISLRQRVEAESTVEIIPAAWRPTNIGGDSAANATVGPESGLRVTEPLQPGDTVLVDSEIPRPPPTELASAGRDYPSSITERYLQLPASTPDRFETRTERLTGNAETPHETALVIEHWLRNNKGYDLDVEQPAGNVADAFLFEMDAGYCTYFATAMTAMLRSQGIPARMAVGYTTGEPVEESRYVVRGYNSHAWVEMYVQDIGWVRYDPTPPGPRVEAEQARLDAARIAGSPGIDTNLSGPNVPSPGNLTETQTPTIQSPTADGGPDQENGSTSADGGSGQLTLPQIPPREALALGAVALVGAVVGLRRSRLFDRVVREVWLRHQRRSDPESDVEGAFRRASYLLERRNRPRRPGETPRQYLDAIGADEDVRRIYRIRERVRYGSGVSRAEADEVVSLVRKLVTAEDG